MSDAKTPSHPFIPVLKAKRTKVYAKIYEYLKGQYPGNMRDVVMEYPLRQGKGLRPALVLISCEMFGGKPSDALLTAAAMQTSEDWILVHDDWQDGSEQRRGGPTLHIQYGPEIAINAGDFLHLEMHRMLRDNEKVLGPELAFKVMDHMHHILKTTVIGQHKEITATMARSLDFDAKLPYDIMYTKAAVYTIIGPLQLGAIIAGAPKSMLKELHDAAKPLGIAFQIRDDLLNIGGDSKSYGKEIGGDILEGKITVLLSHMLSELERKGRRLDIERVRVIWRKDRSQRTEEDKNYVLDLMRECGCVEFAESEAKKLESDALRRFERIFKVAGPNRGQDELRLAMDFLMKRKV